MVEYPLHVCKMFWSRSDIMHVAIAWDSEPLLLLTTALLPNRTTESFQMGLDLLIISKEFKWAA